MEKYAGANVRMPYILPVADVVKGSMMKACGKTTDLGLRSDKIGTDPVLSYFPAADRAQVG
jgi:hypothetical protein